MTTPPPGDKRWAGSPNRARSRWVDDQGRLKGTMAGLSAAAILAVYGAGYLRSGASDARVALPVDATEVEPATAAATSGLAATVTPATVSGSPAAQPTPTATATATAPSTVPAAPSATATANSTVARSTATSAPSPTVSSTARAATATATPTPTVAATATTAAAASGYADGTYSGTGTSRHGNISVSVVVQGGKVVSADISQCGTRYPCSRISQLPARVLAAQSAKVDYVSGATDSSVAYAAAVAQALAKASA